MSATAATYVKCDCQQCGGPMEAPAEYLGRQHVCPHCHKATVLWPQTERTEPAPQLPRPARFSFGRIAILLLASFGLLVVLSNYSQGTIELIGGTLGLFVGLLAYFLPSIVAGRKHRNFEAIVLLNLFLGWTLIGWVVALIWAVYRERTA